MNKRQKKKQAKKCTLTTEYGTIVFARYLNDQMFKANQRSPRKPSQLLILGEHQDGHN